MQPRRARRAAGAVGQIQSARLPPLPPSPPMPRRRPAAGAIAVADGGRVVIKGAVEMRGPTPRDPRPDCCPWARRCRCLSFSSGRAGNGTQPQWRAWAGTLRALQEERRWNRWPAKEMTEWTRQPVGERRRTAGWRWMGSQEAIRAMAAGRGRELTPQAPTPRSTRERRKTDWRRSGRDQMKRKQRQRLRSPASYGLGQCQAAATGAIVRVHRRGCRPHVQLIAVCTGAARCGRRPHEPHAHV